MATWDVLERHFDGLTADEVDAELSLIPTGGTTPTSSAAADYLAEHGGPDLRKPGSPADIHRRRVMTTARTLAEQTKSAVTIDEAAERLGISRSRVSHRLSDGTLWAFNLRGRRYIPLWQFQDDRDLLPGLSVVVKAIPANLHPLAVGSFMTMARPDFDGRSPVDHLASGGNPKVVADWLTAMSHG